jgi:hypothetical protein
MSGLQNCYGAIRGLKHNFNKAIKIGIEFFPFYNDVKAWDHYVAAP